MKKTTLIATSLLLAVTTFSAQAQTSKSANAANRTSMLAPGSAYVDLSLGMSDFSVGNGFDNFDSDDGDTSYSLRAGSYFNENLGLELGYTDFGSVPRAGGTTKADALSLSLVGKLPLSPAFNLLGKIGTTWGRTNVSASPASGVPSGSESGFVLSYGVGAEYAFTPQWSAILQYETAKLKFAGDRTDDVANTTLGVRYKF
jgi:OOP family OmpA-OmpF porin